jgi:hypothetical protein
LRQAASVPPAAGMTSPFAAWFRPRGSTQGRAAYVVNYLIKPA